MEIKPELETFAKIKVVGVGGGGCSAVDRMAVSEMRGIDFVAVNTDAQALHNSKAKTKINIGKTLTKGLGAGMDPDIGKQAAEEDQADIEENLKGADMVFVTCGLGGGTGSGASSTIASVAREAGALTVGVVTKPFGFEGMQRKEIAEQAHSDLESKVDTLITIPNDKILQLVDKKTSLVEAFNIVDDVLRQGVKGISDLITVPGIVNVDFADVKAIMEGTGSALMGIGSATGENRAVEAAKKAIESPLLEVSIEGAKGVLFNISGGSDLGMAEIDDAAKVITESIDPSAKVIFGAVKDDTIDNEVKITVIATGFSGAQPVKNVIPEEDQHLDDKEEDKSDDVFSGFNLQSASDDDSSSNDDDDDAKTENEDELDIPAFIRKKME